MIVFPTIVSLIVEVIVAISLTRARLALGVVQIKKRSVKDKK